MKMNLIELIHEAFIVEHRSRVLARYIAGLIPNAAHVLDVGCGSGLLTHHIAEQRPDLRIEGADVLIRPQTFIPVMKCDGRTLPYADRGFDVVLLVNVLHHTDDVITLLREACRVSCKSIVIKDHLLEGCFAESTLRFMDWVGNRRHGVALPYNYLSRKTWHAAFESCGLEVAVWHDTLRLYPRPIGWIFERSLHFLARLDLKPKTGSTIS